MSEHQHHQMGEPTVKGYLVLIGIFAGIFGLALWLSASTVGIDWLKAMRIFMGLFFLIFGSLKILNLKEFALLYKSYDIPARAIPGYSQVYPFIELTLAAAYLMSFQLMIANYLTLTLMLIGAVGVFKQLLTGSKARCACLGTLVELPLTTVTLSEDLSMALMALLMLLLTHS